MTIKKLWTSKTLWIGALGLLIALGAMTVLGWFWQGLTSGLALFFSPTGWVLIAAVALAVFIVSRNRTSGLKRKLARMGYRENDTDMRRLRNDLDAMAARLEGLERRLDQEEFESRRGRIRRAG
jgi:hypothetical protein